MRFVHHQTITERSFAGFSDDLSHRYVLCREWDTALPKVAYCMLNPSTADAFKNDPTVERCQRRAIVGGFGGYYILNAFALRSTDPEVLRFQDDPVGEENDAAILEYATKAHAVILGWGTDGAYLNRDVAVLALLERTGRPIMALSTNMDGTPRHPLYVSYRHGPKPYLRRRVISPALA